MKYIDDLDLQIVKQLWDGRKSFADIAKKVGCTTNTVRTRVTALQKKGILQIIGLVDPFAIPGHSSAFIGLRVSNAKVKEAAEKIRSLKGIVTAACVTGRFDILACAMFNEKFTYRDFVFNELAKLDGIISTEAFFVVDASGFNLRYVL